MESKDRTEILLVGNELDVLDGLYRELLARSYHVTTAARSEEALSMALQSGVDVVVSQLFSPNTGFPAMTVPMGYTRGVLPAGMTFFGRPWSEPTLIRLGYSYEQATHHRRPPPSVPILR